MFFGIILVKIIARGRKGCKLQYIRWKFFPTYKNKFREWFNMIFLNFENFPKGTLTFYNIFQYPITLSRTIFNKPLDCSLCEDTKFTLGYFLTSWYTIGPENHFWGILIIKSNLTLHVNKIFIFILKTKFFKIWYFYRLVVHIK